MAKIWIDGHEHQVDPSRNLLEVALELGYNLPYFCWHPALGSVGACRQCAVTQFKDEHDTQGRVVMACMTPCADKTHVSIEHAEAKEMRKSVIEFLMTSHPHDCPVCEEGGNCHLQDMTVMTGHVYRRYRYAKRTHRNQNLGPFISHEMNRCIACYRCVRFYRDYAGGTDLDVFAAHNDVYFGRAEDGVLENEFSGNLVEVCPTGVFTDKPYGDRYTRKWDLQQAPSVCAHCSIGCNTFPGERYGLVKRIENRYHGELNGSFLCDRGRYGYGFVNRDDRPRQALRRSGDSFVTVQPEAAVSQVSGLLRLGRALGVGSPRASLESNYALKALVGADNFHRGETEADALLASTVLEILSAGPAKIASVRDAAHADAVLVLGEDVLNTGARLALALRQSVRQAGIALARRAGIAVWQDAAVRTHGEGTRSPLFIATAAATALDGLAAATFRGTADAVARLGHAVAHALDPRAPAPAGLAETERTRAHEIAAALKAAERPLVVSGAGSASQDVLRAAQAVCIALAQCGRQPWIALVLPEANSLGAALLGGRPLDAAFARIEAGEMDTLIVLENDLYRRAPAPAVERALAKIQNLIVLDCLATPTTARADTVLPAGSFAEADGTLVNFEGRAQRYFQVYVSDGTAIRESWRWLQQIASDLGVCGLGDGLDAATQACAASDPRLGAILDAAPNAKFRMAGAKIPRQPPRYSGRTAMTAHLDPHEPQPPGDPDSPFAFSMEGASALAQKPSAVIPLFWAPGWNSPQAVTRFQQEINGHLKGGDPGVRLLAPDPAARPAYAPAPAAAEGLRAAPLHHLFGSEELSARAAPVTERVPAAYLALHPDTAARFGLKAGENAAMQVDGVSVSAPLMLRADLAANAVGIPRGMPGVPAVAFGAQAKLAPEDGA